ncbi:MAG: hypothetical protein H6Q74_765 [Firmicutes bacterium]|nr:hypothetical protein [Bacillota bacterium]
MRTDKDLFAILDREPLKVVITEETRNETLRMSERCRGSVRLATGRFYTDKEYEEKRRLVYGTALR